MSQRKPREFELFYSGLAGTFSVRNNYDAFLMNKKNQRDDEYIKVREVTNDTEKEQVVAGEWDENQVENEVENEVENQVENEVENKMLPALLKEATENVRVEVYTNANFPEEVRLRVRFDKTITTPET